MKKLFNIFVCLIAFIFFATAHAADKEFISTPQTKNSAQEKTLSLIETYFDALNKNDHNLFFSIMDEKVVHDINEGKSEKGIEKFKNFIDKTDHAFHEKVSNIIIMISDDGKYAAAHWVDRGTYYKTYPDMNVEANNQQYTIVGGHFFEIQNGKIKRVTTYYNENDFMTQIKNK